MKTVIEPVQSTETWRYGPLPDLHLRIYANQDFQTSNGEVWYFSSPANGINTHYLKIPLTLNGEKLVFPEIELDPTEDSPTHRDPRLSAYVFSKNRFLFKHLIGFSVPDTLEVITWEFLTQHRDARRAPRPAPGLYETGVVENLIARSLGNRAAASINSIGMAMSSAPAEDPTTPIHVSVTDPLWIALLQGEGLESARGEAVIAQDVDGARVVVPSPIITVNSLVLAFSRSNNVLGSLRVPTEEVTDGESFVIVSTNPVDEGSVGWILFS